MEERLQEERGVSKLQTNRLQKNYESECLMQVKTINRQKQQRMQMEESFKNKVTKLINKLVELKEITINKNNDVSDNLEKSMDEKQLQFLNQLLK